MRILVACVLPPAALDELRALGAEVLVKPELTPDQLAGALADAGVLIVDRRRVSADAVNSANALQMIVRAGTVVANIALEDASTQGIFVCNTPFRDASAIAELAIGLIITLDRRLDEHRAAVREGRPPAVEGVTARGLAGRTLGILGFGPVCRAVAARARSFGMHVLAWSPTISADTSGAEGVEFCAWPRELARRCDFVSIYGPPDGSQEPVVSREFLAALRPGVCLVHIGHPGVLDDAALTDAALTGRIRVASDIYAYEAARDVGKLRTRLMQAPNAIITQRLGSATDEARAAIAEEVVRVVRQFVVAGEVLNCVNLVERSPGRWQLILRLRDAVGVLASVMDAVRADGVNAEEVMTRVFTGARAAWCTVALDERPSAEALDSIRKINGVLHLQLRAMM